MKQNLLKLMTLVALVVLANTAFGQTNVSPYANGTTEYSYTWSGVDPVATTHQFYVLAAEPTSTPSSSTATASHYALGTGGSAASTAGVTANVKITWNNAADGGTYYLAFVATNATCTNWRYVQIDPIAPVDFTIYAVGVSGDPDAGDLTLSETGKDGLSACPPAVRVGADYLSGSGTEGDGTVYVFFRVDRLNGTTANDWTADITTTASTGGIVAMQYSTDASTWGASLTNDDDNDVLYVRAEINVPTGGTSVTISSTIVGATTYETLAAGGNVLDYLGTNNGPKTYIVDPVPAIGAFN